MCGFVAAVAEGGGLDAAVLACSLAELVHRGPDQRGVWVDDDGSVGLAHARLEVTGGGSGRQPLENESGRLRAVVNGEFYGFEQIRRELEQRGHAFRSDSDSEILLHLYEDEGTACLRRLRGEFAFVLWDAAKRTLFAARDRFGMKPLFYAAHEQTFLLASEAKALFAAGVPPAWDEGAYLEHLFLVHGPTATLFRGVSQVAPGHYLLLTNGAVRVERYWDLDFERSSLAARHVDRDDGSLVAAYRAKLVESVHLRVRSNGPVGVFLSGGIDSSTVLSIAAAKQGARLRAFTVEFDDPLYDEGAIARLVAEGVGAEYHPLRLTESDLAHAFGDAVYHAETLGNVHGVARYLQSRAVRDSGCKVALTGDGADETLAGYSHFRMDVEPRREETVPALLRPFGDELGFVPAWIRKLSADRAVLHSLLATDVAGRETYAGLYRRFVRNIDTEHGCRGRAPLFQSLYLWCKSMLPNYSLCADRLEMAFSVEGRHPFLDHELFELTRSAPAEMLIRGATEKHLLREAARPFVPAHVYRRQKHPFAAPHATRDLRGPMMALVQDQLRGSSMRNVSFFDHGAVAELLDALPRMPVSRRVALEPILMVLLCTSFLQQRYHL